MTEHPLVDFRIDRELSPKGDSYHFHTQKAFEYAPPLNVGLRDAVTASLLVFVPEETAPVGGLYCYAVFDFVVIEAMWVKPAYKKRGIGRQLILDARAFAQEYSAQRILASTMSFHNVLGFLKKVGFEIVGEVLDCPKGSTLSYIQIKL